MSMARQLNGYRLTTAEIIYHRPDHPSLLQSYVWQDLDMAPRFPVLTRFLRFWEETTWTAACTRSVWPAPGSCARPRSAGPAPVAFCILTERPTCLNGTHVVDVRFWLLADIQPPSDLRPLYPRKRTWLAAVINVCF